MNAPSADLAEQLFAIPVGRDDTLLLYAPLHGVAALGNRSLARALRRAIAKGTHKAFIRAGLTDLEDLATPATPPPETDLDKAPPTFDTAVLLLSERCSMRCSYCYASAESHRGGAEMPRPLALAAIDELTRGALRAGLTAVSLAFHGGGEPTCAWPTLEAAVAHARQRCERLGLELTVSAAINGVLSRRQREALPELFDELSISCDGLPQVHDSQRPLANGGESFAALAETLELLDHADFPYGLRATVTAPGLPDLAEGVAFLLERFTPQKIQLEPVFARGRGEQSEPVGADAFLEAFVAAEAAANAAGVPLSFSAARPDELTTAFCDAQRRALVVTPQGDLSSCVEVHNADHPLAAQALIGRYNRAEERFVIDDERRRAIIEAAETLPRACRACFCRWHCAGDCLTRRDAPGAGARCKITRALTARELLRRIAEQGDGRIWRSNEASGA